MPRPTAPARRLVRPFSTTRNLGRTSPVHLHLPSKWPHYITYENAAQIQAVVREEALRIKASSRRGSPVAPTVLSFTPTPTYTLGRRQKSLSDEQRRGLTKPLAVAASRADWDPHGTFDPAIRFFTPHVTHSDRGGLTTYHGPGQIVLWPVVDLHSSEYPHLAVRDYARLLEETTRAVLDAEFGIKTYFKTDEPGVWVVPDGTHTQERKIAAMGIHLRRHVSGLGVAINVDMPIMGDAMVNPWARFVPCGLEGKAVTSIAAEMGSRWKHLPLESIDGAELASTWTLEFLERLGVDPEAYEEEEEEAARQLH